MRKTQLLSVHWAQQVFELLERQGLDADGLFTTCGLDTRQLTNPAAQFRQDDFTRLWHLACEASGNPAIGVEMGKSPSITAFGAYSSSQISSSTVKQSLERAVRFQKVVGSALTMTLDISEQSCRIIFQGEGDDLTPAYQGFDAGLAITLSSLKITTKNPFTPHYVEFTQPEPANLAPYQDQFGCPLVFNRECHSICIGREVLDFPMIFANEEMASHHDEILKKSLADDAMLPLQKRLAAEIEKALPNGEPNIEQVAGSLNLSTRTLQRKLTAENTSFRKLVNEVRKKLAATYLTTSQMPPKEITFLLGFSDHANFYRAFRRWYAMSPIAFRNQ